MSGVDRRPYLTAIVLDQALLDACQDNLENQIESVVEIEAPDGSTIYASDRNKNIVTGGVGRFYEALAILPAISRTLGEWLVPELEFATLAVEFSNVDGRFNRFLPGGADFAPWVNSDVVVRYGLAELGSSYSELFRGSVTEAAGMSRTTKSIRLVARDQNDRYNAKFPRTVIDRTGFPDVGDDVAGQILPVVYGDWTVAFDPDPAAVPTFVANGAGANVIGGTRENVLVLISENDLSLFDDASVYLQRGSSVFSVPASEITVGAGNRSFEVDQNTATLWVDGAAYLYEQGDAFFCNVKGKDLSGFDDNIVWQARDILMTYGGMGGGQFHASWTSYRDKAAPAQSAIATIKARVWIQDPEGAMTFALSLLEQVRLEAFFDREGSFKINALHFEDWPLPTHTVQNWDVEEGSFQPTIDEKNNFNRAQAFFNRLPGREEMARQTVPYRNQASITQLGKAISKRVDFPNLYVESDVENQLVEVLRLASSMFEKFEASLTPRSILLDLGDFALVNVQIGSTVLENQPAMIRKIGFDPSSKLPVEGWLLGMTPYPSYTPGYPGTVGGFDAVITPE